MDILILDSWLRELLDTNATPQDIARCLSLSGPSIEKTEKLNVNAKTDYLYHIEVTTNRVDMMSVYGIAREASVILPEYGFKAKLKYPDISKDNSYTAKSLPMKFEGNKELVYRMTGVVMEIDTLGKTPDIIKERLEKSGIRSLNLTVDITNYVMTEIGHPCHVFDYDLVKPVLKVDESKKGEKVVSFDGLEYTLPGGDIVFRNDKGEIIDLPGIIGTKNSVVHEGTKRILFFIDNNDPVRIRKTSMRLGIRTVAATINEKGVDPELAETALKRGIQLYKKTLKAKQVSKIFDTYFQPIKPKVILLKHGFLEKLLGVKFPPEKVIRILNSLEIKTTFNKKNGVYTSLPPSFRSRDITIPEDLVEEVARIYGYHNLPSKLMAGDIPDDLDTKRFEFEYKLKNILKAMGGYEVYTLSLVPENMAGPGALKLKNPLGKDSEYLRTGLMSSLLYAANVNKGQKDPYHLFEMSNVYIPEKHGLPKEEMHLAGVLSGYDYRSAKGIIEVMFNELNIEYKLEIQDKDGFLVQHRVIFESGGDLGEFGKTEKYVYYDFKVDELFGKAKEFKPFRQLSRYPAQIEDITLSFSDNTKIADVVKNMTNFNPLIKDVSLEDVFKSNYTFRVSYQSFEKTLDNAEVEKIRTSLLKFLEQKFAASVK